MWSICEIKPIIDFVGRECRKTLTTSNHSLRVDQKGYTVKSSSAGASVIATPNWFDWRFGLWISGAVRTFYDSCGRAPSRTGRGASNGAKPEPPRQLRSFSHVSSEPTHTSTSAERALGLAPPTSKCPTLSSLFIHPRAKQTRIHWHSPLGPSPLFLPLVPAVTATRLLRVHHTSRLTSL